MPNRNRPAPVAEPTAADKLRAADADGDLADATEVLAEVDTTQPLEARIRCEHTERDPKTGAVYRCIRNPGHRGGHTLEPLAATVPPGADQTTDPTPAAVPDGRTSEPGRDARSDAAGSGRSTALVVADATALQDLGARMEATERKIRGRLAEFKTVASLALLVDAALKQLDYDDRVSPTVVVQLKDIIDGWAEDRGVDR